MTDKSELLAEFRHMIYGDLPMIKKIIETGKHSKTGNPSNIGVWARRVSGWYLNNKKRLSRTELVVFRLELEDFENRLGMVADYQNRLDSD